MKIPKRNFQPKADYFSFKLMLLNLSLQPLAHCQLSREYFRPIKWSKIFSYFDFSRSCYSTLNAAPACSSTILSGKRKREAEFLDETPRLLMDNGETADFRDFIKASRVKIIKKYSFHNH